MVFIANIEAFDLILLSGPLVPSTLALSSFDSARMGSVLDPAIPALRKPESQSQPVRAR